MKFVKSSLVALASISCFSLPVMAETYPSKPIKIIVPYAPGGSSDTIARSLTQPMTDALGVSVIVQNKPGANESIAASELYRSEPDGYTIMIGTNATYSYNRYLFKKLPYDDAALVPVTRIAKADLALYVPNQLPVSNMDEFVAYAQANKNLSYGSAGVGNVTHLAMDWLTNKADLEMTHVPYRGQSPMIVDMIGGQIVAGLGVISSLEPYIKAGQLKALAIEGDKRASLLPDVPTFKESGYEGIEASHDISVLAPPGTNPEVIKKLSQTVKSIITDPAYQNKNLNPFGFTVVADSSEDFAAHIQADRLRQKVRIESAGAVLE